ncbi:MAG: hypothetical protein NTX50_16625, partial [Candidatus Sumerlaeota bacterium]|nr:hypothetical protein [Candidatus Sumerlaeota bacterium]
DVDESFAGRVVQRLHGAAFDGSRQFPPRVKPVDFLVGEYALEFKRIEQEPLTADGRVERIAKFSAEQAAKGEAELNGDVIRLSQKASQAYWRKFQGVSVRRQLEDAAKQIKSTRAFLKRPLGGAVFLVNEGAPFIDATSFPNLITAHRRDFADAIDVVIYLSLIPSFVAGMPKPAVPIGFAPEDTSHEPFARAFLQALAQEMALAMGKRLPAVNASQVNFVPMRMAFTAELKDGSTLTFH